MSKLREFVKGIPIRAWIYAASVAAAFLAVMLPLLFLSEEGALYSVFWGLFASVLALIVARVAYHLATKDNSAEMWAVSIYGIVAALGWLIGILSTTLTMATIGIVILMAGAMMALCTRYIGHDGARLRESEMIDALSATLRYRFMGDVVTGQIDIKRPLIVLDGKTDPPTINEARAAGFTAEAEAAVAYVKEAIRTSGILEGEKR